MSLDCNFFHNSCAHHHQLPHWLQLDESFRLDGFVGPSVIIQSQKSMICARGSTKDPLYPILPNASRGMGPHQLTSTSPVSNSKSQRIRYVPLYLFTLVTIKVEFAPKEAKKVVLSLNGMENGTKKYGTMCLLAYFSYYFNITET